MADEEANSQAQPQNTTNNVKITSTGKITSVDDVLAAPALVGVMSMLAKTMKESMNEMATSLSASFASGQESMLKTLMHGPGGSGEDDDDHSIVDEREDNNEELEEGELAGATVVTKQPKTINPFLAKFDIKEKSKDVMTGEVLSDEFASTVTNMMRMGQSSADFNKEHNEAIPSNCEGLRPVKVNTEVWNVLSDEHKRTDVMLQKAHKQLQRGAAALATVGDILMAHYPDKPDDAMVVAPDQRESMTNGVHDGLQALGHANAELAYIRKQFLKPSMAPEMGKLCGQNQSFTESLFGDDIAKDVESVEVSKKIEGKLAKDTKKASMPNKKTYNNVKGSGNWSGNWYYKSRQNGHGRYTPYDKQGGNRHGQYDNYRGADRKNSGGNSNNWQSKAGKPFLGKRPYRKQHQN